jgi:hypothetical protein
MHRYALSNRQSKELANGKLLRIALPTPDTAGEDWTDRDWRDFAQRSLPEVDPAHVIHARLDDVWCVRRASSPSPLEVAIGAILRDQVEPSYGEIPFLAEILLVDLCARTRPRGEYPPQWPGQILETTP